MRKIDEYVIDYPCDDACVKFANVRSVRVGLQLSDICENPNNYRIGGDPPPPPPPNPNKCLMLDVFMVLHIPGVTRLLPTISTVQGVNSSFIPTENGDERLDCMCMCCCNYHWPKTSFRDWTRVNKIFFVSNSFWYKFD